MAKIKDCNQYKEDGEKYNRLKRLVSSYFQIYMTASLQVAKHHGFESTVSLPTKS